MTDLNPDIVVLRTGTEGLSTEQYTEKLRERLPEYTIALARTPGQEQESIRDARVATGYSISADLVSHARNLELFVVAASGYDHLPTEALSDAGVTVENGAGIHAPGIAEQVIGYCLVFARRIDEGIRRKRNREWRHYKAYEFTDSTVMIVGLGAIGKAVAQRLEGFELDTIGVRYSPDKGGPTDEVVGFDPEAIHDALARTDYLVLATPLSETTRGLIGAAELTTLPPSAVLINVSRGSVVETGPLVDALRNQGLRGAALDVTDPEPLPAQHPLWNLQNVIITPHMGGHTPKHWERLAVLVEGYVNDL